MNKSKLILLLVILAAVALFWYMGWARYFQLEYIKEQQQYYTKQLQENSLFFGLCFFLLYVTVTALAFIPGALILTLLAGALFGVWWGTLIVSFASTIGATLAFLFARHILQDYVQNKFGKSFKKVNEGVQKEGKFYLFALRLVPLFPFFVINIVMGLTKMKVFTFYWVSQIGMILGTVVYVYAGSKLSEIKTIDDIFTLELVLAFTLIGVFPFIAKKTLKYFREKNA